MGKTNRQEDIEARASFADCHGYSEIYFGARLAVATGAMSETVPSVSAVLDSVWRAMLPSSLPKDLVSKWPQIQLRLPQGSCLSK
jgi:hypothetical protein